MHLVKILTALSAATLISASATNVAAAPTFNFGFTGMNSISMLQAADNDKKDDADKKRLKRKTKSRTRSQTKNRTRKTTKKQDRKDRTQHEQKAGSRHAAPEHKGGPRREAHPGDQRPEHRQKRPAAPVPIPLPSGTDEGTYDETYTDTYSDTVPDGNACFASDDIDACLRLGRLNLDEFYSSKDMSIYQKGMTLFKHACDLGSPKGCGKAGETYQLNILSHPDSKHGYALVKKACEMDDPLGCHFYGYHYFAGRGVRKVPIQALIYESKACELGHGAGCAVARWISRDISRKENNPEGLKTAIDYLTESCEICKTMNCNFGPSSIPAIK